MGSSSSIQSRSVEGHFRRKGDVVNPEELAMALRTAFVARFIVLREGRRSRAHRMIEQMEWATKTTADELANMFRQAFVQNGDKLQPVERDISRALVHAERSASYFREQYKTRATLNFRDALKDYVKSNSLLFGDAEDHAPRSGGWRLPSLVDTESI